jgi:hypothetical protein
MAKKTPEELRAKNRERQRKWRSNNLVQAQLKERNAARIRRGTMEPMEKPASNAAPNGVPNSGQNAPNGVTGYGELSYGPFPDDEPYEAGPHPNRRQPHQPGVARKDTDRPPPEETPNEAETYRKFEELKQRKAAGKLNRAQGSGVEVELEL